MGAVILPHGLMADFPPALPAASCRPLPGIWGSPERRLRPAFRLLPVMGLRLGRLGPAMAFCLPRLPSGVFRMAVLREPGMLFLGVVGIPLAPGFLRGEGEEGRQQKNGRSRKDEQSPAFHGVPRFSLDPRRGYPGALLPLARRMWIENREVISSSVSWRSSITRAGSQGLIQPVLQ
jgi:hypothetical protein